MRHIPFVRQGEPLDGRPTWFADCRCGWVTGRTLSQDAAMNHAADHARSS
jgi:hypothetical protein